PKANRACPDLCLNSRGDADLRVRVHGVRVALRGARPERGSGQLPGLRRLERAQAVLRVRDSRHRRAAELRRDDALRRLLWRKLWLRALSSTPTRPRSPAARAAVSPRVAPRSSSGMGI